MIAVISAANVVFSPCLRRLGNDNLLRSAGGDRGLMIGGGGGCMLSFLGGGGRFCSRFWRRLL